MTPPKTACYKPYLERFKRSQNEQILFLHKAISFDLLNLTLSYGKIKDYFTSGKQTKKSKIKKKKKKV